jgi:TolB-like protein
LAQGLINPESERSKVPGADEPEIAFGPYRMDQRNRSLTREGVAVPLGGRAFDTLSVLAAASGATVGKEALLDAVWPGLTVEENNLQVQISALRKALGEGWIVTVPGRGYRLAPMPSSAEPPAAPTLPDRPSVAVLPFANLSGDSDQEYFADGVVEDIITALSRTGWLFVIARNSSFTYKGRAVDVKQVGRELGVRYVLEGGVRKAGNRVRITGQLIDAASGGDVWADRFDGELADIFELQDRVTESVVGAIEPSLRRAEIARTLAKPTNSLDAYDLYLRALQHYYTMTRDGIDAAPSRS